MNHFFRQAAVEQNQSAARFSDERLADAAISMGKVRDSVKGRVIGQDLIVDLSLTAMFSGSNTLLQGLPGVGKTFLVEKIGEASNLIGPDYRGRIQFTPDLMPADIIGFQQEMIDESGKKYLGFVPGPLFAGYVFADEINRAAPRTQSALLQAMQEKKVSTSGQTMTLPEHFVVFATQNPFEQKGTYPLPEAQLDRFAVRLDPQDVSEADSKRILLMPEDKTPLDAILKNEEQNDGVHELLQIQRLISSIAVPEKIMDYIIRLQHNARPYRAESPDYIRNSFNAQGGGSGERTPRTLLKLSSAFALLQGREAVEFGDVQKMIIPTFIHRLSHKGDRKAEMGAEAALTKLSMDLAP